MDHLGLLLSPIANYSITNVRRTDARQDVPQLSSSKDQPEQQERKRHDEQHTAKRNRERKNPLLPETDLPAIGNPPVAAGRARYLRLSRAAGRPGFPRGLSGREGPGERGQHSRP